MVYTTIAYTQIRINFNIVGPYPPPNNINLDVHTRGLSHDNSFIEMIFKWHPVVINCPTLYYTISSNCGLCPNITNKTSIVCSANVSELSGGQCTFQVKTGVCNTSDHNLLGAAVTDIVQLSLTGIKENCYC